MKKLLKGTVAVLLALAMLIPGVIVFAAEPVSFTDVKEDDWFASYVDYCSANGLVNGMSATTFEPDTGLSRAMFVTILYRFAEVEPTEGAAMPFTDVAEDHWGKDAILWAYENEVVNGTTPTTFAPDAKITREQMCTILCRFASAMGYEMPAADENDFFYDEGMISEYAYEYVYSCAAADIVNGITEYEFAPKETATRAQACAILMRFVRYTTTTVTESEAEDGKTVYEYADKYGVYASGYEIADEDGDPLETFYKEGDYTEKETWTYEGDDLTLYKYEDSDGYEITETYTYADGKLTGYLYTDTDGNEQKADYTYNEDGTLKSVTYSEPEGMSITLSVDKYSEDGKILELTATSEGYEEVIKLAQEYTDGAVSRLEIAYDGTENGYAFGYDASGALTYLKYTEAGIEIESTGDFDAETGYPAKLTMKTEEGTYDISIDWTEGILDATLNGEKAELSAEHTMVVAFAVVISCELGNSYEEITVDNIMNLGTFR